MNCPARIGMVGVACVAVMLDWIPALGMDDDRTAAARRSTAWWNKEIRRLTIELSSPHARQAAFQIANITDQRALSLIRRKLPAEADPYVRQAFLEPLARSGDEPSIAMLVRVAVEDSFEENRQRASELLASSDSPDLISSLLSEYLQRNRFVNQAAELLRYGHFVRPSTVPYLITRLVEEQRVDMPTIEFAPTVMDPCVDAVLNRPRLVYQRVKVPLENSHVYQTLKEYTGQDFGYDVARWRRWFDQDATAEALVARQTDLPPRPPLRSGSR